MSTMAPPLNGEELLQRVRDEGRVLLTGVSWKEYQRLMDSLGERSCPHAYDRGSLELMPKSNLHELLKSLLHQLILVWADENDIPIDMGGETTLQREDLERGVEGDEIYWIRNLERLHDPVQLDLQRDPPPDLVIEAEVSTPAVNKLGIYAALGVPEIWRIDADRIRVGRLDSAGNYQWGEQSVLFPTLPLTEVFRFMQDGARTRDRISVMRAFRAWVRLRIGK